jgi:hypothetical protein
MDAAPSGYPPPPRGDPGWGLVADVGASRTPTYLHRGVVMYERAVAS